MPKSVIAKINPKLLIWARNMLQLDITHAAIFVGFPEEKITSWERGEEPITISQLRELGKKYRRSIATFYLPEPPENPSPRIKDYRRLDFSSVPMSLNLISELNRALEKREIMLEMYQKIGEEPVKWGLTARLDEDPEEVGERIRKHLGLEFEIQRTWREKPVAFRALRELTEKAGIIVFQATKVELREMRGASVSSDTLPFIIINRKDSAAGRVFSMFHEIAHLALRASGVCDLSEENLTTSDDIKLEVFCNRVAGAALIPKKELLERGLVKANPQSGVWEDEALKGLSEFFGVSREAVLRRLVTLGLATLDYYLQKRESYLSEYEQLPKKEGGFMTPDKEILSSSGRLYSGLILNAYSSGKITSSDVSDYLGVRTKHFRKISAQLSGGESG